MIEKIHGGFTMERKMKEGMIDNRMVHSTRQKGIERVLQRKGDMPVGEPSKMNAKGKANWKRPNNANTPRKA